MPSIQVSPSTICILRLSAIGDITHVLPTLRTLQQHWPETAITWIIGKVEAALVQDIPGVEFVIFDKSRGLTAHRELWRSLAGRRFDILLLMQASLRAGLCSLAVRAPIRLGFDRARAKNLHGFFINSRIASHPRQHVLDGFLEFPKALGLDRSLLRWDLPLPVDAREFAERQLSGDAGFIVVNPCSSNRIRNFRNWSIDSYAELIDHAADCHGLAVILTGGPAAVEKDYAGSIVAACRRPVINLVGKTSLKQLAALIARARVVVAPDTGPAHIATAVGTPVIGLYATSNPERTGPYLCRDITVNRYPEAVRAEFGREPEQLPWGARVRNTGAMGLITVAEVAGRLDYLLRKENSRPVSDTAKTA